jgi:hypothetical protein
MRIGFFLVKNENQILDIDNQPTTIKNGFDQVPNFL